MITKPPKWALRLVETACRDYDLPTVPTLHWRVKEAESISGHWNHGTDNIFVSAPVDYEPRIRMVLLHELAHWMTRRGHDRVFWRTAWALYRDYNVPWRVAYYFEGRNYPSAVAVWWKMREEEMGWK